MVIRKIIALLESLIENPSEGLPEDIFLFISRITPIINVDLLIKNEHNHTLLTWRDDDYHPPGWHIPGGIVRYKDTVARRISAVAVSELGAEIEFEEDPLAINEVIHSSRKNRGHFISLLYECRLISSLDKDIRYETGIPKPGEWAWHGKCPEDIIPAHEMYREFL